MPSFVRIGKHSNRSQHNLIEQQQLQEQQAALRQLHLQQQQEQQAQAQAQAQQQQQQQLQASGGVGSGGGGALPLSPQPPPPTPQQPPSLTQQQSAASTVSPSQPRRVSAAGLGPDSSHSASPGPAPSLSSNDSFHRSHQVEARPPPPQQQQQQQHSTHQQQPPQPLSPQTQQSPQQLTSPHSKANSIQQILRAANPNSIPPPPAVSGQSILPLSQPNNNNTATNYSRQPRDNFAELVSRSQSARHSQVIPPLQTATFASTDDLSQTVSPIVSSQPHPHSSDSKRSARRLIGKFLGSSSSSSSAGRPTSDHYSSHEPLYENTPVGVVRRPSKRQSNTPRGNPLLARSIDHPDWVPPPGPGSRQPLPIAPQQPIAAIAQQQSSNQTSPTQPAVADFDSYRSHPETSSPDPDEPLPPTNTVRHVPADSDDQEDLAFHQQQAIALHQAKLLQQGHALHQPQPRPSAESQHKLYNQVVVDPAQGTYQYTHQPHDQYQHSNASGSIYAGHLTTETPQPPNPETVSQLSHESPTTESEQATAHLHSAQESPAVSQPPHEAQLSQIQRPPSSQSQGMAPPPPQQQPGAPGQGRRSVEKDGLRSVEPPPGPPPGYRHSQANPLSGMSPLPPTPGAGTVPPNFRPGERQQYEGAQGEDRGRNSPQPSTEGRDADHDKQFKDLLTKYKNVKRLYFDGKTQIEAMTAQVEQLQNAVANQRMSQSRTALDDSEYSTRFQRLNGAINNLSFNHRKDWERLPSWIERYVSQDALKTGKQEMTAVGRAIVSRWVIEEIFNKCFHPALDVDLSYNLKQVEQNIRNNAYTMSSQEEYDALTAKVVSWRMTTLEGLQHMMNSADSVEHRADYTKMVTSNLTAYLYQFMTDPAPAGVDGSSSMIVELAVGIAANLPLESRDVALTYPMPGDPVQLHLMEPEKQALPPLPEPVDDFDDAASRDGDKAAKREKTKSGMLTMLGGVPHPASSRKGSTASLLTDTSTMQPAAATTPIPKDASRVRFAGFIGVEVRGRQVLCKAPVWTV